MAAPSIIQHKVKTISQDILKRILEETFHAEPDDLRSMWECTVSCVNESAKGKEGGKEGASEEGREGKEGKESGL